MGSQGSARLFSSDLFDAAYASVTRLGQFAASCAPPHCLEFRFEPNTDNGLRKKSQVMVDKAQTVRRDKVGATIGRLHEDTPSRSIGVGRFFWNRVSIRQYDPQFAPLWLQRLVSTRMRNNLALRSPASHSPLAKLDALRDRPSACI